VTIPTAPSPITTHAHAGTLLPDDVFVAGVVATTLVVVFGSGAVTVRSAPVAVLVTVDVVGGSVTVVETVVETVRAGPVVVVVIVVPAAAATPVPSPKNSAASATADLPIASV
jgi:hypothetical protein